ncbi:hypothetical protein HK101_005694, partial [Irineochytrium annulatum]
MAFLLEVGKAVEDTAVQFALAPFNFVIAIGNGKNIAGAVLKCGEDILGALVSVVLKSIENFKGGRALVIDGMGGGLVEHSWGISAFFTEHVFGRFDCVVRATSPDDLLNGIKAMAVDSGGQLQELQIWCHGYPDGFNIGDWRLDEKDNRLQLRAYLKPDARVWVRSCSTFRDQSGYNFLTLLVAQLGCQVVGHTCDIDLKHQQAVWMSEDYGGFEPCDGTLATDYDPQLNDARFRCSQGDVISYGDKLRFIHQRTDKALHSHDITYSHPGSSQQREVTCYGGRDYNNFWIVAAAAKCLSSGPVRNGDIITLIHLQPL